MADVKWIKITTTMFEDEKIDFIESLPEADALIVIWMKLLTLAGKCNQNGYIMLTEKIQYTDEMLAHKFRRPLNTVRLALQTFSNLGMIISDDIGLRLPNWEKHQNIEGLDKIREQNRKRVQQHRERQRQLQLPSSNVTCNVTVTQSNAIELEEELDIDKKKERKKTTKPKLALAEFVKMTEEEHQKLIDAHGEFATAKMIEILDNYKGANGKKYDSDYRAILKWVVDEYKTQEAKGKFKVITNNTIKMETPDLSMEEFLKANY